MLSVLHDLLKKNKELIQTLIPMEDKQIRTLQKESKLQNQKKQQLANQINDLIDIQITDLSNTQTKVLTEENEERFKKNLVQSGKLELTLTKATQLSTPSYKKHTSNLYNKGYLHYMKDNLLEFLEDIMDPQEMPILKKLLPEESNKQYLKYIERLTYLREQDPTATIETIIEKTKDTQIQVKNLSNLIRERLIEHLENPELNEQNNLNIKDYDLNICFIPDPDLM